MPALRSLPTSFPMLRERDYFTRRLLRAKLLRDLAQAHNYLWANMFRVFSGHAYEGNGYTMTAQTFATEPSLATGPNGRTGKLLASFIAPKNWGASQRAEVRWRSIYAQGSGLTTGKGYLCVGVYTSDGVPTGVYVENEAKVGTDDASCEIVVPPGAYQIQVWLTPDLKANESGTLFDTQTIPHVSIQYAQGNSTEIGGDTPQAAWQPIDPSLFTFGAGPSVSAALLRTLIRNANHLFSKRPPTIGNSWLGETFSNSSTYREVGRYVVRVSPHVNQFAGKVYVHATHAGAGNDVRILVDGVVVWTSGSLVANANDLTVPATTIASGLRTITIEARSTAAGSNWGSNVLGVHLYEEGVSLGITPYATYQPVDENEIEADDAVVDSTILKIIRNDGWLAKNRINWLVGDWRHRTYKRVDTEALGGAGTVPAAQWDWTRGPDNANRLDCPKNITIRGDNATADSGGVTAHDLADGFGTFSRGLSNEGGATYGYNTWPAAQTYFRHGRRLSRHQILNATGAPLPINNETGARCRFFARARRARPNFMRSFNAGSNGPSVEEPAFKDQAYVYIALAGIQGQRINITSSAAVQDSDPRWFGPVLGNTIDTGPDVIGRCPKKFATSFGKEGELFEVELLGSFLADEPLTKKELDALP